MTNSVFSVQSSSDSRIRDFVSLTDMELRRRTEEPAGLFIAEGFLVLERVIAAGLTIRVILTDHKRLARIEELISTIRADVRPDVAVASAQTLEQITGFRVHRGVLASVQRPLAPTIGEVIDGGGPLLILEGLVDSTNVGLAFRSAAAMGFAGAIVSGDCADPLYRRSVRTSMGAVIDLPWARDGAWPGSLQLVKEAGMTPIALSPDPQCPDIDKVLNSAVHPVAAVFGTEGEGLRERTRDVIGTCARIPMGAGIDSLNIAASVAVVGHALRSARARSRGCDT